MSSKLPNSKKSKNNSKKIDKSPESKKKFISANDPDVLVNLPAGLKYKVPGKRQRVLVGSIVIGLNVLLVISVVAYFYSPAFQEFIYNFGRS